MRPPDRSQSSLTTLVGKVDYEITANGGVDEQYIAKLAALPVNARFSPVIEQPIAIPGTGLDHALRIDTIALATTDLPNRDREGADFETSAVISADLANRLHLKPGDHLLNFTIQTIAPDQNNEWMAVDIAAAQSLLNMYGKLDRIEVFLAPDENASTVEREIKATIPATWDLQTPGARSEENRRMLRAFRWNLRILSYISLLVGAFLIYNTIAVSVVRRRTEIGILRALGVSSRGVLLIFLGEATMLGLIGSALGIALGRVLAAALLGMISDTVNALFTTSTPGAIELSAASILAALFTGTAVAFASALIPAREAARVAPAEAMRQSVVEHETRLHIRRDLIIAAFAAVIAYLLCQFGPIDGRPVFGYVATLFAVIAAAMLSPAFVTAVIRILRTTLKRLGGAAGLIAGRSLVASLSRTSIVVTALATAISMMVGRRRHGRQFPRNRAGLARRTTPRRPLHARPGTRHRRHQSAHARGRRTHRRTDPRRRRSRRPPRLSIPLRRNARHIRRREYGHRAPPPVAALPRRRPSRLPDHVIVTEPFADKHHVHVGDVLQIPLGTRTAALHRRRNLLRLFERPRHRPDRPLHAPQIPARPARHEHRDLHRTRRSMHTKSAANSKRASATTR